MQPERNIPPLRALRRQAEILPDLISGIAAAVTRGTPADRALAGYYREHREFGSRDRRFFSAMVFAWLRWRGWLPGAVADTNLMAAACLDGLEEHPTMAWLAQQRGQAPASSWTGLTLEERARCLCDMFHLATPPAPAALLPEWFAEVLFQPDPQNAAQHLQDCICAFQTRPPTWVRLDRHPAGCAPNLPAGSRPHAILPCAAALPPQLPPDFNPNFTRYLEIQDLASQAVGLICAPRSGEYWWDACAGSGGKALHLADLMQGSGTVLATDPRPGALATLQKRLRKHAPLKVRSRRADAARAPRAGFDGVLVDAPCSGLGTWHRNPDARWRTAREQVQSQALTQKKLLDDAAGKVRAGGRLIYAVCTLTTAETVGVLDDFLERHADFRLCPGTHPLTGEPTDGRFWIWPWQDACNGMFIAALQHA